MWMQCDQEQLCQMLPILKANPALAYLVERIEHYLELEVDPVTAVFRKAAKECGSDGDLEFDDDAVVSVGSDPGAYVMGWKWIYNSDADLPEDQASEEIVLDETHL